MKHKGGHRAILPEACGASTGTTGAPGGGVIALSFPSRQRACSDHPWHDALHG